MKKLSILLTMVLLVTGCSSENLVVNNSNVPYTTSLEQTDGTNAETSQVTTNAETEDDNLILGTYNNDEVTDDEKSIGVTAEKKAAFIKENGYDIYDVGMQSVPFFLNYSANNRVKIDDVNFTDISNKYNVEEISIKSSYDGHDIPADLITNGDDNKDTVIVVHGLGENRRLPKEQISMFLEMGYNVLAYDQRSAGDNTANYSTYGILEHYDTSDYVKYLSERIADKKIILFGKSMGGITVAMSLGDKATADLVSYVILDSPVGSFRGMLEICMHGNCPDEYIDDALICDDMFMKYFLDISFDMGEAADYIRNVNMPVLILSSRADDIVPFEQQQGIYDAIIGERKYIYADENATHCGLIFTQTDLYKNLVEKFLNDELV